MSEAHNPPRLAADSTLLPPPLPPSSGSSPDAAIRLPSTPTIPITPLSPSFSSPDVKPKKANPLNDLIDTEKTYVDQLTGVIRKVAAAWSRSNLPPPDLDVMFRSIEGVYKANRGLHSKLKEIGTNPSSPKALGDLLMQWIDDLNGPYTTYCTRYRCGFDTWGPVQANPRLADVLSTFSASYPPPPSTSTPLSPSEPPTWTLDDLFLLPKARLKYYKKLYGRLLKSTAPGRSDHRLLVGALDSLDGLLDTLESRATVKVGQSMSSTLLEPEDEVVIDLRTPSVINNQDRQNVHLRASTDKVPESGNSSTPGSSISGGERLSQETASTSVGRVSPSSLSMPVTDLERRLATDQTLDIFTMKPKVVRLQMAPPALTYTRELRLSIDVIIRLTPQATGIGVVHSRGHIFLLSDLFLVCERMTPEERLQYVSGGPDMWLRYPPLAGKVLRVSEVAGQDNVVQVAIMRKETLILQVETKDVRDFMLAQFKECIEFAGSVPPVSKQPPPPLPPLNGLLRASTGTPQTPQASLDNSDTPRRQTSPLALAHRPDSSGRPTPQSEPRDIDLRTAVHVTNQVLSSEGQMRQSAQRLPSIRDPVPTPMMSRPSSSAQQHPKFLPSFSPGEVVPPGRSSSFGHQAPMRPGPGLSFNPPVGQHGAVVHPQFQPNQPNRQNTYGSHPAPRYPPRPPSEPSMQDGIRKSLSTFSLPSQYSQPEHPKPAPPIPPFSGGFPPDIPNFIPKSNSYSNLHAPQPRPLLPSAQFASRTVSTTTGSFDEPSPPSSPVEETPPHSGPVISTVSAQMKCKVFLQQHHAQWKALGAAKLKLYRQDPTNIKQLVVEAENKDKSILISTIVLTDGVERVGKTGVAIELSDKGTRTGIIYMIQLRNEKSAGGLFDSLLAGSDRASRG